MFNKKQSIVTAAISALFIAGYTPVLPANDIVIAQAHQQSQEKANAQHGSGGHGEDHQQGDGQHRHGRGGHGDDHQGDESKDKGSHGKDKSKNDQHGDGGHDHSKKSAHDYAHVIISHTAVLKLTDEQLGKIVRLHLKNKDAHEKLKHRLKEGMQAFQQENMNPGASDEQLRKLGKNHINDFNAMIEHHIKERQAIQAVLSDQQKALLKSIKTDHDHDSHGNGKSKSKSGHGGSHGSH